MPATPYPLDRSRSEQLAALQAQVERVRKRRGPVLPFGIASLDDQLADGGLDGAGLHEIAGATASLNDDAAATLFIARIAARFASEPELVMLWALTRFDLYAPGLEQIGLGPSKILYAQGRKDADVLALAEDGLRDGSLACVVAEVKVADQTATRRLQLAASEGKTPILLYRRHRSRDRCPLQTPSSAMTRWRICCAPSAPLAHPISFLRDQLEAMRIVRCGDLRSLRDGRNVEVAGVVLVRQRPGSAKGILFVTIEDETGIANGILWPNKFEIYRRQIMSASMIAMRGRLQKEGEIIHIICDRITDHDAMLRSIGRTNFTVAPGRGDGATSGGGPDPRDPAFPSGRTLGSPPFGKAAEPEEILRLRSHDFH